MNWKSWFLKNVNKINTLLPQPKTKKEIQQLGSHGGPPSLYPQINNQLQRLSWQPGQEAELPYVHLCPYQTKATSDMVAKSNHCEEALQLVTTQYSLPNPRSKHGQTHTNCKVFPTRHKVIETINRFITRTKIEPVN